MRHTARSLGVAFLAVLGAVSLTIASAFTAAFAYGAVALIVPGTGTPDANIVAGYLTQARDRYLTTTACGQDGLGCPDANLQGINYPASLFPLAILPGFCRSGPDGCDTLDESVAKGTATLNTAIDAALNDPANPDQTVVVFGYSQGGAVVADSLAGYINGLSAADKARIQVVTIGGVENPDGGTFQRFSFLNYIPFLDISLNPPMKPDTGVNYTSYSFEYDPVADFPKYVGNALAFVNSLAAFESVHGNYLAPNGQQPSSTLPYGYTDATLAAATNCTDSPANCRKDEYGNTYVTIPALTLPIYDLPLSVTPAPLKPLLQPIVNLLTPVTRLLIDLGYDNSSDRSVPTPLSILPFNPATFSPVTFAGQFVRAIGQGIYDAQHAISSLPLPTTTTPTVAPTLAATSTPPAADATDTATSTHDLATVTGLTTKKLKSTPSATAAPTVEDPAPTTPAVPKSATTTSTPTTPATPTVADGTLSTVAPAQPTNPESITRPASTREAMNNDITKDAVKKDGPNSDTGAAGKKDAAAQAGAASGHPGSG